MAIVGFSFTKINVEKNKSTEGSITVKNNVKIEDIKQSDMHVGSQKQVVAKVSFTYISEYSPKVGKIELGGELIYMNEQKVIDEVVNGWEKDKKIPEKVMTPVVNNILSRANILALNLTKEVNLPPQLKLPRVEVKK
ncbi:MAG: hypothetical protein ACQESF_00440 [Nanobdellota archaeon]